MEQLIQTPPSIINILDGNAKVESNDCVGADWFKIYAMNVYPLPRRPTQ